MTVQPSSAPSQPPLRDVYSVTRLNREVRTVLEGSFPLIWVEAEISNFTCPRSGHFYFSLKDEQAQVRCAMFRNRNMYLRFRPENGQQVLVRARISLYEGRGEFQLIVEHMEEAGDGLLQRRFEALKQKLAAEGLFDSERKRPLPTLPRRIGVITSPTGAAIRDILSVLARRFPTIPVLLYPVAVQGQGAGEEIARALATAARRGDCDVLILARGGGSLEDLWAFNEEVVARAIRDCRLPVVAGVGHEVDVTIADFAADLRAPTPSAAAEAVTPDRSDWQHRIQRLGVQLRQCWQRRLQHNEQRLQWLRGRLERQHPGLRLRQHQQRLDELENRLLREWQHGLRHRRARLQQIQESLRRHAPAVRLATLQTQTRELQRRLNAAMDRTLERQRQRLGSVGQTLHAVSPLATLERGYAIVLDQEGGVVRRARQRAPGDRIETRLAEGRLICTVDESRDE